MRADVVASEDTTTLYLRWEIAFEPGDLPRLQGLGGALALRIASTNYVDVDGKEHETFDVEVPLYPHNGARNRGQAKFTDYESRRAFWEALERGVVSVATPWLHDAKPGSVPLSGHFLEISPRGAARA